MVKVHPLKYVLLVFRYIFDIFRILLLIATINVPIIMIIYSNLVIKEYNETQGVNEALQLVYKNVYLATSLTNSITMGVVYVISFAMILYLFGSTMVGDTALNIALSLAVPGPLIGALVGIGFPVGQFVIYLFITNSEQNFYFVSIISIIVAAFHFIFLIIAVIAELLTLGMQIRLRLMHPDPDLIDQDGIQHIRDIKKIATTYFLFVFKGKVKTESRVVS
jgi:hypothetical protein